MKIKLKRLDILSNTNCNFNCANCTAYSRQQEYHIINNAENYIESLQQLQKYATIDLLYVYGGESTLHPNIEQFLLTLKQNIPDSTILEMISNGWWMPNEEKFSNLWKIINKLGQGVHPELLDRLTWDEIRACMKRIRQKYNIITNLYLDPSFALLGFTDIPNNNKSICRFAKCIMLLPNGKLSHCGMLHNAPEYIVSNKFNELRKKSYFDVKNGNAENLQQWLDILPNCCQYCTGDTIKVPHYGYDTNVIQECKYPGDE